MSGGTTGTPFENPFDPTDRPVERFDPERDLFDVDALLAEGEADVETLRSNRDAGDWESLFRTGREMHARGERRLHILLRAQEKLATEARAIRAYAERVEGAPDDPPELDESLRTKLADGLRERADSLPGSGSIDIEKVAEDVEAGRVTVSESSTDPLDDARMTTHPRLLREQRDLLTWQVCEGYAAMVRARLWESVTAAEPTEHPDRVVADVDDRLAEIRDRVTAVLRTFYADLVREEFDHLESAAHRGAAYPDELVAELGALGRRLREARRWHRQSDSRWSGHRAADVARVEMRLGRTVRLLTFLVAASYRHLFLARQDGAIEECIDAVERARETRFESLVRDGVNADVDDLLESPGEYDGRLVEVEGFAEDVRHVTDDGYGTKFDLVEPGGEARIEVFYPYRNLVDTLLFDGAYVHLNGEFVASCDHVDGGSDIHLDAVNVGENAEESWFDHLASEFTSANLAELYPFHANARWSLETPTGGGGD